MFAEAALYSQGSGPISISTSRYFLKKYGYLIKWKKNPSVLDIGTGDGNCLEKSLLPILPGNMKKLVSIDQSAPMIAFAKKNKTLENVQFRCFNITQADLPNDLIDEFDHIFTFYLFHWIQETREAFENMFKLLKPDGTLFSMMFTERPSDEPLELLSKNSKWAKYRTAKWISPYYKTPHAEQIYKRIAEESGFVEVFVRNEIFESNIEIDQLIKLMTSVNQTISEVLPCEKDEYLKAYEDYYKNSKYIVSSGVNIDGKEVFKFRQNLLILFGKKTSKFDRKLS